MNKLLVAIVAFSVFSGYAHRQFSTVANVESELRQEKAKNEAIQGKLQAVTSPLSKDVVPIQEICAVPESYLHKKITIQGTLISPIRFASPFTDFPLEEGACLIHCVFRMNDVDPKVRRLLSTFGAKESIRLNGSVVT